MAVSVLMTVGEKFYKLHEIVDEAMDIGVSKRIPLQSLPEGLEKGKSRIFLAHPKAIVKVTAPGLSLADLADKIYWDPNTDMDTTEDINLLREETRPFWAGEDLLPNDFVPGAMLGLTLTLSRMADKQRIALEKEFGLVYCMGIFGWAPYNGAQYVAGKNETGLPEEIAHLEEFIEPVHVAYEDDGEGPEDDDEE